MNYFPIIESSSPDTLLLVFDIVRHGSRAPKGQGILNATKAYYPMGPGQLTAMGQRQMYLRGKELRRRYIESSPFLSQFYNPQEIYAYSTDLDRTISSAVCQLTGLYPPGNGTYQLWPNQTEVAVPPFPIEHLSEYQTELGTNALIDDIQVFPIHGNQNDPFDMLYHGYDPTVCPTIGELQKYDIDENKELAQRFSLYKLELFPVLIKTLNLTDVELDIEMCRMILDEIFTNEFEQLGNHYNFSANIWELMDEFWMDYYFNYAFGSDVIVNVANTRLFDYLMFLFDAKANITIGNINPSIQYMQSRKYMYISGLEHHIAQLVAGFDLPHYYRTLPSFASSFLFEFYQKANTSSINTNGTLIRQNYFVKVYYNDIPIQIPGVHCDSDYKCAWDSMHTFLQNKMFKDRPLLDFCFSHITPPDKTNTVFIVEDVPWYLAIIIGFVLAVITCVPIQLIINCRRRKQEEVHRSFTLGATQKDPKYTELENRGAAVSQT